MADEEILSRSPIYHFLDLLSDWDYTVPMSTQWAVAIAPECVSNGGSYDQFFSNVSKYTEIDFTGFNISPNIMRKVLNSVTQPNTDGIGLHYAQKVSIPGESFSIGSVGTSNSGGFLKGTVGQDRMDIGSRKLSIDFLETNLDFVDGLMRPWIIAGAHRGLINLGLNNSIKCMINIIEMTNSAFSTARKPIRKVHQFFGCMPIALPETNLQYENEEISTKRVEFTFNNYQYKLFSRDDQTQ